MHVSEVPISLDSGMGRVEWNWRNEFENRGFLFIHIGPLEVNGVRHPALFPYQAFFYFKRLRLKPDLLIVHEPASGVFANMGIPCFVESHGVELRNWRLQLADKIQAAKISLKSSIFFPIWRLRNCNKGLRRAQYLLLINEDDKSFCKEYFGRKDADILVFKNGVYPSDMIKTERHQAHITLIFNASWIDRKGKSVLVEAAKILKAKGLDIRYLLIGTGSSSDEIVKELPENIRESVTVISRFKKEEEQELLAQGDIFVLPSYYEGQPLSLLQAMEAGLCSIATNCCGQKDIIQDGQNGFLFEVGDHNQLAVKIEKLFNERALLYLIGANAKTSVESRRWEQVNKETVDWILSKI